MSSHDDNIPTSEQAPYERRDSPRVHINATITKNENEKLEVAGLLSINGFYFECAIEGWANTKVTARLEMGSGDPLELAGTLRCPKENHPAHYLLVIADLDFDIERILARYLDTESKAEQLAIDE